MRSTFAFLALLLLSGPALAASTSGQRYIEQLTQGSMHSIKSAAQSMYNTRETDTEALDVAAEVLLQNYARGGDTDTMAWVAKALGRSHNGRYYNVLKEIADNASDKKLRKHAKSALKEVGSSGGEPYVRGSVNLSTAGTRKASAPAAAAKKSAPTPAAPATAARGASNGLDVLREGMSMQEAYDLVGPPTSSSSRQTGKAWIPFNYKGADLVRTYALYKGKGRVVFSTSNRYNHTMRIIEIQIDPNERGYH